MGREIKDLQVDKQNNNERRNSMKKPGTWYSYDTEVAILELHEIGWK